jgi:hypothetical protein
VAFSARNFTASGSMTWTVASGDQTVFRYQTIAKKVTIWFALVTTTVGGTPAAELLIALPASAAAAAQVNDVFYYGVAGTQAVGFMQVNSDGTQIRLLKDQSGSGTWANSSNLTSVWGQIEVSIS